MSAYVELYEEIADRLPGSHRPLVRFARGTAMSRFAVDGFPSPRDEDWRYTNISPIEKKLFKPAPALEAATELNRATDDLLDAFGVADAYRLVLVNGHFSPALSSLNDLPEPLFVGSVAHLLKVEPERVEVLLNRNLDTEVHGLIGYNGAFFNDGLLIDVRSGFCTERPLQIIHIASRPDTAMVSRNLIRLGSGSRLQVMECFLGAEGVSYLTAAVTEAAVGENASLDYYRLQQESDKAYHFNGLYLRQEAGARLHHHNVDFGGLLARGEIHTVLGDRADCRLNGLFLGRGRQHVDNHTLIQHKEPHATSSETYRGVLADRARGVFQGRIVVHPQAQKSQADMSNRNLLLSDDAEIDTKPQLEILADDVKCSHGVTVGQLDPESVFYLASRGVDQASARNMLTFAFANEMIEKIELDSFKVLAQQQLLEAFPQSGIRKDWL
jgi:Fe-S cluster assembly protein SufD